MTPKLFTELGLSPELIKAIDRLGFDHASPIQAEAIPILMAGKDAVGQSQTGSGKTAAFGIPAVEKVDPQERSVQVLILCPTRELAVQVSEEIHKLAFFKRGIQALPVYGGQSYERQFSGLKRGANIVIGTPGRVMDHMRRGTLNLNALKLMVLDEADVMLNMGFRDDIEFVLKSTPATRQTVFFSATMPRQIRELIETHSTHPVTIQIEQQAMTVPTVEQVYYEVDRRYKIEALTRLIDLHDFKLGIIFCNTKRMVDELVDHLNAQGYSADRLHGDMSQPMRDRVMNKFRKLGIEFLVATDVAARGIDVDDVQVVFNYDLPYDGEDYVHRIGRTGRKGRDGRAITFVSGREVFSIRQIERYTNMRIPRGRVPSIGEVEEARSDVFLGKIRETLAGNTFQAQQPLIERLLEEGYASTDIAAAILHQLKNGEDTAEPKPKPPPMPDDRRELRPDARPAAGPAAKPNAKPDARPHARREPRTDARPDPRPGPHREARTHDRRDARPASSMPDRPATRPQTTPRPGAPTTTPKPPEPARTPGATPAPPHATTPENKPQPKAPPAVKPPRNPLLPDSPPALSNPSDAPPPEPAAAMEAHDLKGQTRIHFSVGAAMGVLKTDIVTAIHGETGLPAGAVKSVELRDRHAIVTVSKEHANAILSKMKRARLKGKRLKVKLA